MHAHMHAHTNVDKHPRSNTYLFTKTISFVILSVVTLKNILLLL